MKTFTPPHRQSQTSHFQVLLEPQEPVGCSPQLVVRFQVSGHGQQAWPTTLLRGWVQALHFCPAVVELGRSKARLVFSSTLHCFLAQ